MYTVCDPFSANFSLAELFSKYIFCSITLWNWYPDSDCNRSQCRDQWFPIGESLGWQSTAFCLHFALKHQNGYGSNSVRVGVNHLPLNFDQCTMSEGQIDNRPSSVATVHNTHVYKGQSLKNKPE